MIHDEEVTVGANATNTLIAGISTASAVVVGAFSAVFGVVGTYALLVDSAVAGDVSSAGAYTVIDDRPTVSDWVARSVVASPTVEEIVEVAERFQISIAQMSADTLSAQDAALLNPTVVSHIEDAVQASDVLSGFTTVAALSIDGAASKSTVLSAPTYEAVATASAADSTPVLLRVAGAFITESAAGAATAEVSAVPQGNLLVAAGISSSSLDSRTDSYPILQNSLYAADGVTYNDPEARAWVMNTETTAVSWYSNFQFESVAQAGDRTFAAGPNGLYELTGSTDEGELIEAEVITGLVDFKIAQTKRVDAFYFGYTSEGQLSLTVETPESGVPAATYSLEQRDASAPRNSRVVPGKGLFGRYWRVTLRNVGGVDFEIHDATIDVAVSTRRV